MICVLMGGRAAEELLAERVTTGAGNDIERATDLGPSHGLRLGNE